MRVFVTGATGFIGGHVARLLRERDDEVVALVRDPEKAEDLRADGVQLCQGSLADRAAIVAAMTGCDAAIHGAAVYEVGIAEADRPAMRAANVDGTRIVLGTALEARIPKVVYISTIAAFGNTQGEVVDESYEHPAESFTSYYEQTKHEAHEVAKRLIAEGLPCVIVQPGGVYGPGDHSAIGKQIHDFVGRRMPAVPFPDLGLNLVHVEDVAAGVLLALDRGAAGRAYVLGSEITTLRGMIETTAGVVGRRAPRRDIPTAALRMMAPIGPVIGKLLGQPPNLRELISSSDGVTFWASHGRAVEELGFTPRSLEAGLRDTLAAEGKLPTSA